LSALAKMHYISTRCFVFGELGITLSLNNGMKIPVDKWPGKTIKAGNKTRLYLSFNSDDYDKILMYWIINCD